VSKGQGSVHLEGITHSTTFHVMHPDVS